MTSTKHKNPGVPVQKSKPWDLSHILDKENRLTDTRLTIYIYAAYQSIAMYIFLVVVLDFK